MSDSDSDDISLFVSKKKDSLVKKANELTTINISSDDSDSEENSSFYSSKRRKQSEGDENFLDADTTQNPSQSGDTQMNKSSTASDIDVEQILKESKASALTNMSKDSIEMLNKIVLLKQITSKTNELCENITRTMDSQENNISPIIDIDREEIPELKQLQEEEEEEEDLNVINNIDVEKSVDAELDAFDKQIYDQVDKTYSTSLASLPINTSSSTTKEPEIPTGLPGQIYIKLRYNEDDSQKENFFLFPSDTFEIVFQHIQTTKNVDNVKLLFDGDELSPSDTPQDLDIEGEELIDVQCQSQSLDPFSSLPSPSSITTYIESSIASYITNKQKLITITLNIGNIQTDIQIPKDLDATVLYTSICNCLHWENCLLTIHNHKLKKDIPIDKQKVKHKSLLMVSYEKTKQKSS
ncbi:hypothetical protein WA158_001813 [Blastocystis sp. Blastoise]